MKRYMLFMFDSAYPGGGAIDFADDFDSVDDVAAYLFLEASKSENRLPIWHIFDTEIRRVVVCSAWIDQRRSPEAIPEGSYGDRCIDGDVISEDVELVLDVKAWAGLAKG